MRLARPSRYASCISNVVIDGKVRMFMWPEYDINYSTSILHLLLKRGTILFVQVIIRSIYNKRSARGFFFLP